MKREQKLQRINLYKSNLSELNESIALLSEQVTQLERSNVKQSQKLDAFRQIFARERDDYRTNESKNQTLLNELVHFQHKHRIRQADLITDLSFIFPIENGSQSIGKVARYRPNENGKILSVSLKLTNLTTPIEDQENSIALGYIAQAIQLVADILNVPLRYPLLFRSSRSFVVELSTNELTADGQQQREYALFKQNNAQDDFFPYAISLLNKNLSQLRILFDSYKNVDPNETLINLKWMFDFFKR